MTGRGAALRPLPQRGDRPIATEHRDKGGITTVAELGPFDAIDARLYALFPIPEAEPVRRCRKALMQTSIRAMSRLGNARDLSDEAIMLEHVMHNLAGQFTFRRGDDDVVHEAARLCLRLRMCATQLDKLEGGYAIR